MDQSEMIGDSLVRVAQAELTKLKAIGQLKAAFEVCPYTDPMKSIFADLTPAKLRELDDMDLRMVILCVDVGLPEFMAKTLQDWSESQLVKKCGEDLPEHMRGPLGCGGIGVSDQPLNEVLQIVAEGVKDRVVAYAEALIHAAKADAEPDVIAEAASSNEGMRECSDEVLDSIRAMARLGMQEINWRHRTAELWYRVCRGDHIKEGLTDEKKEPDEQPPVGESE